MEKETFEIESIDEKAVEEVKSKMLEDEIILKVTDSFKTISDPTRLKILYALSKRPLHVGDLAALLNMSHSAISHQLRVLRKSNLVKFKKEGKMTRYFLADEHVITLIKMGVEHAFD